MRYVQILPDAVLDAEEATAWYESQQVGLGIRFLERIHATIERISQRPESYQVQYSGVRRALVRQFPYSVYFLYEPGLVEIIAILHQHGSPDTWKGRVK